MATQADVQALYDALMRANAAEPYEHAVYEALQTAMMATCQSYYGPVLAELAREVQLDCGEVWSREKLAAHHRMTLTGEMVWNVTHAVHVRTDEETREIFQKLGAQAKELQDADPNIDLKALMTEIIAEGVRSAALDHGIEL